MNQSSKIQYYNNQYNSMFDDSESEEEIKDSANDTHEELNGISNKNPLFPFLKNIIMNSPIENNINQDTKFIAQSELNKIQILHCTGSGSGGESYFKYFCPKNGDFSIIFKYLRNLVICKEASFYGCQYLKTITIPEKISKFGKFIFSHCNNLETINFQKNNKNFNKIPHAAFYHCENLKTLNLPNSIISIGDYAFCRCQSLQTVKLPDTLEFIGEWSFARCKSLKKINIPKNTKIEESSFLDSPAPSKIMFTLPNMFMNS